jgi:saccharopine dehydrogenase-like NADP-dependent oxidoreductase
MTRFAYLVFGAGRQGTAAVHDLALHCEARDVLVVEPDAARRRAAERRLSKLLGRGARVLRYAAAARASDWKVADVALSCAPYGANVELTRHAVAAGTAFCDLGGNPATVSAQAVLAARSRVPVVPECGVSPGISNILAVHCARVHGCDEVHVRCGGLPLVRPDPERNPLLYKLVFSPWGLISEYSGDVPCLRDGKVRREPALSTIERFDAGLECSPTSNNSPQVVAYLARCGVREYDYRTIRYDGHWSLVQGWRTLGFLRGNEARDRELAALLSDDPVLRYDPAKDRDVLVLSVRGSSTAHGLRRTHAYRFDVPADQRTKFAAMELTTCWGITIVAHHMASGRGAPRGFATPERFVDTTWFLAEVERRLATVRA